MPSPVPTLTLDAARAAVEDASLIASSARRVGIEIEWLPVARADPAKPIPFELVRSVVADTPLPAGCTPTFEPGGQLELSTPPLSGAEAASDAIATDTAAVARALDRYGIDLVGLGLDPRALPRVLDAPRYAAMEAFFDADGPDGRRMMRNTASVQINLEAGSTGDADRRWKVAHALGPVLGAAFANSPFVAGSPSGWKSSRLRTWWAMDRTRTWPAVSDRGAVDAWARYAMGARVMMIRDDDARYTPMANGMTMADWVTDGHALGHPTADDVRYHLTTLFPPVRLRGWLELRFVDALPDPWWRVAVAVTTALLDDDDAAARAEEACAPAADLWHQAARAGLEHPVLATAARACFDAALDALPRLGAEPDTKDAVGEYAERFVARGRTPSDDALEAPWS
jgi:glutamate--cysteine ligase